MNSDLADEDNGEDETSNEDRPDAECFEEVCNLWNILMVKKRNVT